MIIAVEPMPPNVALLRPKLGASQAGWAGELSAKERLCSTWAYDYCCLEQSEEVCTNTAGRLCADVIIIPKPLQAWPCMLRCSAFICCRLTSWK